MTTDLSATMSPTTTQRTLTPEPIIRLENYFQDPYNLAVATARTCYSSRVISSDDVGNISSISRI